MENQFEELKPKVKIENEFLEIANDFGDPLEVLREAISNAYDHGASLLKIKVQSESIRGKDKLVIEFEDNGDGMTYDRLVNNFWDLGNSSSIGDKKKIGEKGHGTKIFLRSDFVNVITSNGENSFESICENPYADLNSGKLHSPKIRRIATRENKGTFIRIEGYNADQFGPFNQLALKDYIYWFTKLGSFEGEFNNANKPDFKIYLQGVDQEQYEELPFGHIFAVENKDINSLFEEHSLNAIDFYVKKYVKEGSLPSFPHVKYNMVIYVEGDQAKRLYNPLISNRKMKSYYKVSDRYGIWLAKDFIPVQRANDWISGFGKGSNAFVLLHGFINCQKLKLTANRGTIANTDHKILEELRAETQDFLESIDEDLYKKDLYTLQEWQKEDKTLKIEKTQFEHRKKIIANRKVLKAKNDVLLFEPKNESELFGFFISIYALYSDKFDFEPLDYNTNLGIDIIARNKTKNKISDCEFWYVELKYLLNQSFNHSFNNVRWIVCWDFDKSVKHDSILKSTVDNSERFLSYYKDDEKNKVFYFLDSKTSSVKIQIIRLKDFVKEELKLDLVNPNEI